MLCIFPSLHSLISDPYSSVSQLTFLELNSEKFGLSHRRSEWIGTLLRSLGSSLACSRPGNRIATVLIHVILYAIITQRVEAF